MTERTTVVFGGTGFLGRAIVHALAARGDEVRVAARRPDAADLPADVERRRADVQDDEEIIAAVEDAGTVVEILQRPLGGRLRPEMNDETGGRFLARFGKVVPETSLERHRRITLAGTVMDQETRPLDQTTYTYPVIRVEEYHLWPVPPKNPPNFTIGFGVSGTL